MSALGHYQTFGEPYRMSALPPKADIGVTRRHVCYGPAASAANARDAPDDAFLVLNAELLWALGQFDIAPTEPALNCKNLLERNICT
jgi:hypothetical protein